MPAPHSDAPNHHATDGELAASISNGIVQLIREYTGRGPTRARTSIGDDVITVVLADTLTKGEQSLVQDGQTELVLSARKAYQNTMYTKAIEVIEQLTGRKVVAFLSDNHLDPDVAAEVFVLEPAGAGDGSEPG